MARAVAGATLAARRDGSHAGETPGDERHRRDQKRPAPWDGQRHGGELREHGMRPGIPVADPADGAGELEELSHAAAIQCRSRHESSGQ